MAEAIRYRTGIDARTGRLLRGAQHLEQSLAKIWSTRLGALVMELDFGTDLRAFLSEDVTPALALAIYNELTVSAYAYEPEYGVDMFQLVRLTEGGTLGLRAGGLYFPEGRFGNYAIAEAFSARPQRFGLGGAA